VAQKTQTSLPLNLLVVRCDLLNKSLVKRAKDLADRLLSHVAQDNVGRNHAICKGFKAISSRVGKKPANSEELVESEAYMDDVKAVQLNELAREVTDVKQR
jgi:hypothetical protein